MSFRNRPAMWFSERARSWNSAARVLDVDPPVEVALVDPLRAPRDGPERARHLAGGEPGADEREHEGQRHPDDEDGLERLDREEEPGERLADADEEPALGPVQGHVEAVLAARPGALGEPHAVRGAQRLGHLLALEKGRAAGPVRLARPEVAQDLPAGGRRDGDLDARELGDLTA